MCVTCKSIPKRAEENFERFLFGFGCRYIIKPHKSCYFPLYDCDSMAFPYSYHSCVFNCMFPLHNVVLEQGSLWCDKELQIWISYD